MLGYFYSSENPYLFELLISHYESQLDSLSKILYKSCDFVSNSLFLIHLKKYGYNTIE
jgi:hypothetical protein